MQQSLEILRKCKKHLSELFIYVPYLDEEIYCQNGQAMSIYGDFCKDGHECPTSIYSNYAMKSNCSYDSNHFCPMQFDSSKICINKMNVSISDYCRNGDPYGIDTHWTCPKANYGLDFEQCYTT